MPQGSYFRGAVRISLAVSALAAPPAAVFAQTDAPAAQAEARDERALLWRGLRAGMNPREVLSVLRRQGIRAELGRDEATGRELVETPRAVSWAGRPYLIAMGFVDNGLFYVDINSLRRLSGRIAFERAHFSRVARLLAETHGPAVQVSPQPLVSNVEQFGLNTAATARFEHQGVRVDLTGNDTYSTFQRDVFESVTVRFWRVADAERFAATRPAAKPAPEAAAGMEEK